MHLHPSNADAKQVSVHERQRLSGESFVNDVHYNY
jgi:hypothetical protein